VFKKLLLCLSLGSCLLSLGAQAQTGLYPYGSFDNVGFDTIDRGSLNVHFAIPVVNKAGRGLGFSYQLVYDGLVWSPHNTAGVPGWTPLTGFGLHGQLNDGLVGYVFYAHTTIKCYQPGGGFVWDYIDQNYVYHDSFGASHPFAYADNDCTGVETGAGPSADGSGYSFDGTVVTAPNGQQISPPFNSQSSSATIIDSNGNYISNHGDGTFTDTLGKTALTISGSGNASSPKVFTYSTPTGTAQVVVSYKTYTVQTNFTCSIGQYNMPQDLVDKITLADGSVYQFAYETTPTYPSSVTGRLAQLILPQGGVIQYQYTGANNGIVCADGTPAGLTRTGGVNRTYVRSSITATTSHTDVTDGLNNVSNFDFVMSGSPQGFYETQRTVNQTSPSGVLLTRQTCYNTVAPASCTTAALTLPITQIDTYETLNGQQHGATIVYNTYGLQTNRIDYDFSTTTNAHGTVMRRETWAYPSTGIPGLLYLDTVTDGTNNIGQTAYLYDETTGTGHAALVGTSVPQHLSTSGQRGNLTTVKQYPGSGSSFISTEGAYEDTGNAVTVTGPTGQSSFAYDAPTHAFTVTATPPTPSSSVSLPTSATYDANSGVLLTTTDPNGQTVTYASYDPRLRPTEIDYPDGGKTIAGYCSNCMGWYNYMTPSTHTNTQTSQESYGRPNWVAVQNATGGYYWNNYCYDGNGNLQYSAYRFTSGTLVCSGTGGDTYTYDALGRVSKVSHGDSSTVTYAYNGRATQVTDENGVTRITQVDGLGRPTFVCEVSNATLFGVGPVACGLDIPANGFLTSYVYATDTGAGNALKTAVTQGPASGQHQTRTFETDWLGRTTLVVEPETGTTTYSYTYSAGAGLGLTINRTRPQANQTGSATTTTTTQYDSVGRIVSVNYSDSTPSRGFAYDTNIYWTQVGTNLKGRLAATGGGTGSTWNGSSIGYDAMGRVNQMWQCGPATCGTGYQAARPLSFAYDWAGNLTQETDNVSGTITYGRSIAGEVTSITNGTYTNLPYNPPNLVSSVVNGPNGPVSYTLGNGLTAYRTYDSLTRLVGAFVCNGPAAPSCSGGTQIYGTAAQWKGAQMQYLSDTLLNQQITYGYGDGFNRLTSQTVTFGTLQNYTYAYDRYGNRVSQTALQGGYNFNPTINPANNQITTSGYAYDAAGNMTNDTVHRYTYDAEGNITAVDGGATAQYVYDVFNHRVHVQTPSATTEYIYDYAGRRISSWLSPNNTGVEGRIYWDGQQVAYRSSDGTTYFDHQDTLGTERMRTSYAGSVGASYKSLPWADGYTATVNNGGADQDNLHFAGLERDAESGTEHAQFRNYASAQGRWLAPDPYLGSYDPTNPQSMNRYAYALNNPTSAIDPSGLDWCIVSVDDPNCGGSVPGGGAGITFVVTTWSLGALEDWVKSLGLGGLPANNMDTRGGGGSGAPNKGTFTKKYLPPGAQSCSAIFNFHAPPGFDLNAIIAAGRAGGANPFAALRAVGHNGTFDFQRSSSGGNTTFYSGYTDASNIAVGAYLYGAGFSNGQASFISNSFANTMSSNAGSPQQSDYRNLGYDLAAAGWNPSCH
jgi:RHS repeat-associated protein